MHAIQFLKKYQRGHLNSMTTVRTKKRTKFFSSSFSSSSNNVISPPTQRQLKIFAIANGIPMVGFGFMDQTVMLQAGNAIDCSIGVTFGLSTLTAAAVGQVCSNAAGILFGGTIGNLAKLGGLPSSNLSPEQRALPFVRRVRLIAQLVGVLSGCIIGLSNLLFIDTERSSDLKLLTILKEENETKTTESANDNDFVIETSNEIRPNATTFVIRGGQDVDGLLAAITTAFTLHHCSVLEMSASKKKSSGSIEDIFVVVNQDTNEQLTHAEMEEMAILLSEVTTNCQNRYNQTKKKLLYPKNINHPDNLKVQIVDLEDKNLILRKRVTKLEAQQQQQRKV